MDELLFKAKRMKEDIVTLADHVQTDMVSVIKLILMILNFILLFLVCFSWKHLINANNLK